jgi:hypothetical protein
MSQPPIEDVRDLVGVVRAIGSAPRERRHKARRRGLALRASTPASWR